MPTKEKILRPVGRVRGGAFLPHFKRTAETETVLMPPPATVRIPLSQHIGAPATAVVKKGDEVFVGTLIAEASSFVSAPVHSSVSGTVKAIEDYPYGGAGAKCIVIESDGKMTPDKDLKPFPVKTAEDLIEAAKACGLVGLGGAGFPAHVKLKGQGIDTLVVNAAECEPYLTSDYRECMDNYDDVVNGVYLIKEKLGLEKVIICVESNKPQAIRKLYEIATDHRDADDTVKLMRLPSKYPQGAEKVLIYSATGRMVPPGKLPGDVGCIVMNVTSIGTLYRFITTGMPLVSKRITLEGTAIRNPRNLRVPIGTSIADLLAFAEEECEEGARVMMGGPMMGNPVSSVEAVVEKRNNGILVMKELPKTEQTACIRCGRCKMTCPMKLSPARVEAAYLSGLTEQYEELNVNVCMECGCCSYVCPAKRPLTQVLRVAKAELRRKK